MRLNAWNRPLVGVEETSQAGEGAASVCDCDGGSQCGGANSVFVLFHARDGGDTVQRGGVGHECGIDGGSGDD